MKIKWKWEWKHKEWTEQDWNDFYDNPTSYFNDRMDIEKITQETLKYTLEFYETVLRYTKQTVRRKQVESYIKEIKSLMKGR